MTDVSGDNGMLIRKWSSG